MENNDQKIIVIATIVPSILVALIFIPFTIFAESGNIIINILGPELGDNIKISAYTDQDSWEWNQNFGIRENIVKQVNGITNGEIINICIINLNDGKENCASGTFDSNGIAEVNINLD